MRPFVRKGIAINTQYNYFFYLSFQSCLRYQQEFNNGTATMFAQSCNEKWKYSCERFAFYMRHSVRPFALFWFCTAFPLNRQHSLSFQWLAHVFGCSRSVQRQRNYSASLWKSAWPRGPQCSYFCGHFFKIFRADFLNAFYFRRGLTCTLGLANDLIDGGQLRAKNGF